MNFVSGTPDRMYFHISRQVLPSAAVDDCLSELSAGAVDPAMSEKQSERKVFYETVCKADALRREL